MKNESAEESPKKLNWLLIINKMGTTIFFIGCAIFAIFVGMRFLTFMEREEAYRVSMAHKQSEVNYVQLQQMITTIKQEIDLILDQRRENQALQARIQELTGAIPKKTEEKNKNTLSPNPSILEKH